MIQALRFEEPEQSSDVVSKEVLIMPLNLLPGPIFPSTIAASPQFGESIFPESKAKAPE